MATYDDLVGKQTYTISEVADILRVHRATVSRFIRNGDLRASRLGHRTVRITGEALVDFLQSRETLHQ